ncbi:hypothetical protein V8G54_023728, partial [Vigna mungo]
PVSASPATRRFTIAITGLSVAAFSHRNLPFTKNRVSFSRKGSKPLRRLHLLHHRATMLIAQQPWPQKPSVIAPSTAGMSCFYTSVVVPAVDLGSPQLSPIRLTS